MEAKVILDSGLPMAMPWSGSIQTNCCRSINSFVSIPGTGSLRSSCRFTTYGQFAVAFMLTSGHDYERLTDLVKILKIMKFLGHPLGPPANVDEVNPLVAYLTSRVQLDDKTEASVLRLLRKGDAGLRDCDVDHVLLQARVHRLVGCINEGVVSPRHLVQALLTRGIPSTLLSHATAARIFVLAQALPHTKHALRKFMLDIERGTTYSLVNDFGTTCVARCDEVQEVKGLVKIAGESIRGSLLQAGRPLSLEMLKIIKLPVHKIFWHLVRLDGEDIIRVLRASGYNSAAL